MSGDTATGDAYLAYQYGDAEKLRIRYDAHRRYSAVPDNFRGWAIEQCDVHAGMHVLDAGCGPGTYHSPLLALGARVSAFDVSRGMVAEAAVSARTNRYRVGLAQASLEAIPFADASFERVMSNHVLYHVPDIALALREIRRVVRPGGRIVIATNASDNNARMFELHAQAAVDCGFTPASVTSSRFTLDDLPLVQSVFPSARVLVRENAFIFPNAAAMLPYYASYAIDEIEERSDDGSHREPLLRRMREIVNEIVAREGVLRVPKDAGVFVADV